MTSPLYKKGLREIIEEAGGEIPFERFMLEALYGPSSGYYAQTIRVVGRRGDYSTNATIGPALGRAIAAWARSAAKDVRDGPFGRFHLVEVGAGGGELASRVLESLPVWERARAAYHVVEVSETLRCQQHRRLEPYDVQWHDDIEGALEAAGGRALVFSNELVDAFPCVLLVHRGNVWKEVLVAWDGARAVEVEQLPRPEVQAALSSCAIASWPDPPQGQRVEVHLAYREWLHRLASRLEKGSVLTVDYGDAMPALYRGRPDGTLRAFFHHTRFEGDEVYERFGEQDLTADVCFTDLSTWGAEVGLETVSLLTQREFVLSCCPELAALVATDPALGFVLDEHGAGIAYKVLWQRKKG